GVDAIGKLAAPGVDRVVGFHAERLPRDRADVAERARGGACRDLEAGGGAGIRRARKARARGCELIERARGQCEAALRLAAVGAARRHAIEGVAREKTDRDEDQDDEDEDAGRSALARSHQCVRGARPALETTLNTAGRDTTSSKCVAPTVSLSTSSR